MSKFLHCHKPVKSISGLLIGAMLAACSAETSVSASNDTDAADPVQAEAATPIAEAERDLFVNGLAGTFLGAGDDAPVVLIVPGSGPTDRDGNSAQGIRTNAYRQLAEGLNAEGISSLRVDKRGMYASFEAGDPNAVTVDLYAQDYRDWVALLREETGRDCVYLLGHSEGGTMVSATAAQYSDGICGLILLAAPGRPYADLLREQLQANPANAPILAQALPAIASLEAGETVDPSGFHPGLQGLFNPAVQGFLISVFAIDPAELVREAGLPTLVVQGVNDIQVSVADAERLADAGGTLTLLPGVNHVLKTSPEDRAGNLATYGNPDLPLADTVIPSIVDFIEN